MIIGVANGAAEARLTYILMYIGMVHCVNQIDQVAHINCRIKYCINICNFDSSRNSAVFCCSSRTCSREFSVTLP